MNSQDKRMSATVDYNNSLDDYLGDLLNNILDFPVESLDGDGFSEGWASKLGPIPLDVFWEVLPPAGNCIAGGSGGGGGNDDGFVDVLKECYGHNVGTCEPKFQPKENLKSQVKPQQATFSQDKKLHRVPKSFKVPSPKSVLQQRTLNSVCKTVSFGTEITIPVRTRTKRSWSGLTSNPWSKSLLLIPLQKMKKRRRNKHEIIEIRKCTHCEITKTPQWREGPTGPKSLCNACGVRYRSGRLFPEYRPAESPTFIPSLHSSSHRKVVELRQKPLCSNVQTQKHTRV